MGFELVIKGLQAAIAPCVLLSGFGFLLLSMTNRLGRATDRVRILNKEAKTASVEELGNIKEQVSVLFRRCKLLQAAIGLLILSIFAVSLNVLLLFFAVVFDFKSTFLVQILFIFSVLGLSASLLFFFWDIRLTLKSLRMEIKRYHF